MQVSAIVGSTGASTRTQHLPPGADIQAIRGRDAVLRMQPLLTELSEQCGQPGVMDDIAYFLSKPGALSRTPCLLLIPKNGKLNPDKVVASDLIGAVLLYQYNVLGQSIRMFTTNDRSGRGTLVAPAALRASLAEMVTRTLLDRGALAVLISYHDGEATSEPKDQLPDAPVQVSKIARWARREREIPGYLPLESTFEATLAGIGQRTRRNLRYYRKRAEAELGCTFHSKVEITRQEFLAFNRECMYAVADRVATWRYESLDELSTPVFVGMKDKNGSWLSMLGGRRHHGETEILWQMNRDGLSVYSLSLVMRSYFIEHEIQHGMKKLCTEGGTPHPMRFSFVQEKVTDLVCLRKSLLLLPVPALAKRFIKPDNELAQLLMDKSLYSSEKNRPSVSSPTAAATQLAEHEEN